MRGRVFLLWSLLLVCLAILPPSSLRAQTPLDQAISARFPLTIATADRTDIVTPGAVMVLRKPGIIMFATTASARSQLIYKDGKVSPSVATRLVAFSITGRPATNIAQRTYVQNEKLWLIDVRDGSDGVVLQLLSDVVGDVRYTAFLKVPFLKGGTRSAEEVIGQIAQVLLPEGVAPPAADTALPASALPPVPPPPPPPDAPGSGPPTLETGQTKDQVIAGFGQPLRVVKMGAKEVDYYKDMKVTYLNGKVSKIE